MGISTFLPRCFVIPDAFMGVHPVPPVRRIRPDRGGGDRVAVDRRRPLQGRPGCDTFTGSTRLSSRPTPPSPRPGPGVRSAAAVSSETEDPGSVRDRGEPGSGISERIGRIRLRPRRRSQGGGKGRGRVSRHPPPRARRPGRRQAARFPSRDDRFLSAATPRCTLFRGAGSPPGLPEPLPHAARRSSS